MKVSVVLMSLNLYRSRVPVRRKVDFLTWPASAFSRNPALPKSFLGRQCGMHDFLTLAFLFSVWLPIASHAETTVSPQTYLSDISAALTKQWPTNRTINIVCHGHSVPAGYFKTPLVDTFNAYPHLLHKALKDRFPYAVINVTVTAIGGENAESGAKRFEKDVLSLRPDVVAIDYALNDRGIGLARAEAAWKFMITNAVQKGIKIILLTPTPDLRSKLEDPADPLNQHAEQVRRLARDYGVGLGDSLAQFRTAIEKAKLEEFMSQSNHPNRRGHDLVVAELLKWFP